jgi:hypothetical protein
MRKLCRKPFFEMLLKKFQVSWLANLKIIPETNPSVGSKKRNLNENLNQKKITF